MKSKTNPFHIESVATYGEIVRTCEHLDYMRQAGKELKEYLVAYVTSERRYGAAIGLQGGHGSGKTHLLMWLSEQANAVQNLKPIVLYAKADRASIFDLYTQMLSKLPREKLLEILDQALRGVAKHDVRKAKVTEGLSRRIEEADNLTTLNLEENIDLESLHLQMQAVLENPNNQIPDEIPRAVTQLSDAAFGEKIYQWLVGKAVPGLEDVGLDHTLLQLHSANADSSDPDIAAVNVLETIAALLRLAERPLIVLVDQLEGLLGPEPSRQAVMFSVIKKLIEQLNRQNAITLIAGNDASWKMLPPDVPPRLRLRQPIRVGNLKTDETRLLLEAYMADAEPLSAESVQSIHSLAGGNPREILRIAYYAYEKIQGDWSLASPEVFVASAGESGSVLERTRRALEIADEVLAAAGSLVRDLLVGSGILIDRVLRTKDRPRLVLIAVKAIDKLSEIDSARRVHGVVEYMQNTWQGIPLIVVSVGYSSDEVRSLLETAVTCIQFNEIDFAGELKTKVAEMLALQASVEPAHGDGEANPAVLEALKTIASRLDQFEGQRAEEESSVAERFATKTEALSAPAEQERELRTRWDLLDLLDKVQEAVNVEDMRTEQELMKSLLVQNELNLKLNQVDYLGGVYFDVLSEEINWRFGKHQKYATKSSPDFEPWLLPKYRLDIIRELRRLLRSRGLVDRCLETPFLSSLIAATMLLALELPLIYFYARFFYVRNVSDSYPIQESSQIFNQEVWNVWWRLSIPVAVITLVFVAATTLILKWTRTQRWRRITRRISIS